MKRDRRIIGITCGAIVVCVVIVSIVLILCDTGKEENVVYRETTVEYGDLTVGVTEDSEVNIGTMEQRFDLDISALVNNESGNSQGNTGDMSAGMSGNRSGSIPGGMSMGGMQQVAQPSMLFSFGGNVFTSESREMEVAKVHINVGQEIKEGDVLYTLTEESVNEIRSQLETDVTDTLAEYDSLQLEQQEDRTEAQQEYATYALNGKLASLVYDQSLEELDKAVTEAEENLLEKQNQYNENLAEIIELQTDLAEAKQYLREAEASVTENYENRFKDPYYYTVFRNTRNEASILAESIEEELNTLIEENENVLTEIDEATRKWNDACRKRETGKLQAQQTMETDQYYANVADEWYSIQTEGFDIESQDLYNEYTNAVEKLESFDSYIHGMDVISEYSGVITDVTLSEGDGITRGTSLVTLYNQDEVTMDVRISEADYESLDQEGKVNITFTAYPDEIYTAVISEVSDAEYDNSTGGLYYTLTVTVQGDTSGLYEGMTGEVTFVTKETQEVLYVSNRAIFRKGTRSYVKIRDDAGKVQEKDVVTGFSDGVNVEIVEGLSEGDIVLIESKVSES